jgi:hypothetical protein
MIVMMNSAMLPAHMEGMIKMMIEDAASGTIC